MTGNDYGRGLFLLAVADSALGKGDWELASAYAAVATAFFAKCALVVDGPEEVPIP